MKIAPFLLCAQISCALVAALDGILSEGVKVSELFDRSQLAAENGYQVGHGQKGLPKRLWRREDQQSQVEKRSIETEQEDAPTEGTKDKWTSFSEGLNTRERWVEVEKRSGGVFKRGDTQDVSVTIGGFEVKEEHLLAFIAEDKYKNPECQELQTYCKKISGTNGIPKEMDPLVKGICQKDNGKDKCKNLKAGVTSKCDTLKKELEQKLQDLSNLTNKDCTTYEPQCFFLEGADPTQLKEGCNKLRNACYQMRREDVAVEVLLRAMSGDFKEFNNDNCQEKLKKYCADLSGESNELLQKCLDPSKTCTTLQGEARSKCVVLKREVEGALEKKESISEDQCRHLLEQCHFYDANCKKDDTKCKELKEQCEKKNFIYTPPDSIVNPIEQAPGFFEKIDLEALYDKSAEEGVFIGKLRELSRENFLALITPYQNNPNNYETECEKKLKENCKNRESFLSEIKGLCKNENEASNHGENACQLLKNNIKIKCDSLKRNLQSKGFEIGQNKIYTWKELEMTSYFTERDCEYLESQCLYLEKHCTSDKLEVGCQNLRAACYKRALYDLAYVPLEVALRGELSSINARGEPTSDQKKKLLVSCQELRNQSIELFQLCIDPETTLNSLGQDIYEKAYILKPALDHKRDFPDERDCVELKNQCEHLEKDSYLVEEACHTLKTRCQFRRLSEDLKHRLLDGREDMLKNETECKEKLKTKCHRWNRRWKNPFAFPCALRNDSCKLMTQRVEDHCMAFNENLEKRNPISGKTLPGEPSEENCLLWVPHCENLTPNCNNVTVQAINQTCTKLQTSCQSVLKKREYKNDLKHKLKGNLKEEDKKENCKKKLIELCKDKEKSKEASLKELCGDEKGSKDNDKQTLCEELIKEVQWHCPMLKIKLEEEVKEVDAMSKEYKDKKKAAEKAMNEKGFVLSFKLDQKTNKVSLFKRDQNKNLSVKPAAAPKTVPEERLMTIEEALAIETISQALELYVELKEKCKELTLDCDFKEDCPDCKISCGTILSTCSDLKPLMLKQPPVIQKECEKGTKEGTTSEAKPQEKPGKSAPGEKEKPETPGKGGGGGKEEKKCDPITTVDKWTTTTSTKTTTITSTSTKTLKVTLTSTRKCKPTKCTTGKGEPTSKGDEEEVVPSGGRRWLPSVGIAIVGVVVAIM